MRIEKIVHKLKQTTESAQLLLKLKDNIAHFKAEAV
jgi:hypothetical protein